MRKENDVLWRHLDETLLGVNVFFSLHKKQIHLHLMSCCSKDVNTGSVKEYTICQTYSTNMSTTYMKRMSLLLTL